MCDTIDAIRIHFDNSNLFLLDFLLAFLMFGIALNLDISDFIQLFRHPRKPLIGLASQYILLPLITYAIVVILHPCPGIALGIFLLGACPGGNMSNFLSHLAKGNVALSVTLTASSTVLAPLMTPFNFWLYGSHYAPTAELMRQIHVSPFELFNTIIIILGVPLLIGMILNHRSPVFTNRIKKPVQVVSVIIFLSFIVFAFAKNYGIFMQIIGVIFLLVFLHNGLAMLGGYGLASLFRLDFADRKCLSIETGIHNAALGLIIVFAFFDGLGGMAVVAGWWGIWDLVSGFCAAAVWARMASPKPV